MRVVGCEWLAIVLVLGALYFVLCPCGGSIPRQIEKRYY